MPAPTSAASACSDNERFALTVAHARTAALATLGQSLWLDYLRRDLILGGGLLQLLAQDGLRGMTSNPAIFAQAIEDGHGYELDIQAMGLAGESAMAIYEALSQQDVRSAADVFRPLYDRTGGKEGYVSLEVNPHLAHDTAGTVMEAHRLWRALDRPNVLIKIPATAAGLPAIQQLISEGISINATLLFGLPRYRQVADAYLAGLAARAALGLPVHPVASVASFFLSRIDAFIDPLLAARLAQGGKVGALATLVQGQVAIASARLAYQHYLELRASPGFAALAALEARPQRLLWASTGTKRPDDRDVKYVEALIGPETITTLPLGTLEAFRDHGEPQTCLEHDLEQAAWVMTRLPELGISIDQVTQQLEVEGIEKFTLAFDHLLATLARQLPGRRHRKP